MDYEVPAELAGWLKVGTRLKLFYNEGNVGNYTCQIRAIVDTDYVVFRIGGLGTGKYQVENIYYFVLHYQDGYLTKV